MTYHPTVIVAPSEEPIGLPEAKSRLRVDGTDDDNDITEMIVAAREYCEKWQGKTYFTTTLEKTWDCWPWCNSIELPRATPLQSVTSVIYKDQAGNATTWPADQYIVDTDSTPGRILLAYGCSWPSGILYPANGIRIRYVAGHGAQSPPVPFSSAVRQAIFWIINHLYENREAATIGTLMQSTELIIGAHSFLRLDEGVTSF